MRPELTGEVTRAVFLVSEDRNTLVTRLGIEEMILKNPKDYPNLSRLKRSSMRCIISRVMNESYPRLEEMGKPSRNSFIWKVLPEWRRR